MFMTVQSEVSTKAKAPFILGRQSRVSAHTLLAACALEAPGQMRSRSLAVKDGVIGALYLLRVPGTEPWGACQTRQNLYKHC